VIDTKEHPIGFMSKSFHGAQLNWSTFEQEAYAIHQTLKHFEYILRDVKFTLRTDHRNLLYINDKASPKVHRWKLDVQQFNFDVEHIPGKDNIVADLYSRLATIEQIEWDELIEQYDETQNCVPLMLAASTTLQPTPRPSDPDWQVPLDTEIQTWISEVHGGERGHGGLERTLRLLQEKAKRTWKTMRRDVRRYIRNCPACQLLSDTKIKAAVTPYNVSVWRPMERLNIDTIGPLPDDERGNCYIIVIIDVFSRLTESVRNI
jgi:hypothetical protein